MTSSIARGPVFWLFCLALFISTVLPFSAHAQELIEPLNNTANFLVRFLLGPIALAVGALVLLGTVIGFAFGRVSPQQLLQTVLVLAAYFGVERVVAIIKQVSTQ